jgi:hypothetical protein
MTPEERQRMAEQARDISREMGASPDGPRPPNSDRDLAQRGTAPGEDDSESSQATASQAEPRRDGGSNAGTRDGRTALGPIRDAESGRDVDVIDARRQTNQQRDPRRDRVMGELFDPERRAAQGGGVSRDDVSSILQQAARDGEQAIEDRSVPARYDRLLRRYFQRLPARVLPTTSPSEVAPLAPDAVPSAGPSP